MEQKKLFKNINKKIVGCEMKNKEPVFFIFILPSIKSFKKKNFKNF